MFISTIAAVSCLAAVVVRGAVVQPVVDLEGSAVEGAVPVEPKTVAAKLTSNLPSWLRTPDVKLMPLKNLVQEQEIVRQESEGKIDHKLAQQETEKSGPSPHSLAMKNVVAEKKAQLHKQAAAAVSSPQVKHLAVEKSASTKSATKANRADELTLKQAALQRLIAREKHQEAAIKKAEVHKLAALKKRDGAKEAKLKSQISHLEAAHHHKLTNEKAKLKAEMAQIEEEENEKIATLKRKMAQLDTSKAPHVAQAAPKATHVAPPTAPKVPRAHTVVTKKAVKVHTAEESTAAKKSARLAANHARETQLSWDDAKTKRVCTDNDCGMHGEDSKWLAHKSSVDKFAEEATKGDGKAKAQALAHMQALQKQIENDYKHVTGFAVTQEHALPPVHQ